MLIESLLVAVGGAALALPVALLTGRALVAFLETSANPIVLNLTADLRLIAFVGAALLFVRSFGNLARVDTGFEQDGTIAVTFVDRQAAAPSIERRVAFQQRVTDEIRSVPGVAAAASSTQILLSGANWFHFFRVPDLTTMVGATGVLAAAAGLAGSIPAWRAARVDPQVTLRCD